MNAQINSRNIHDIYNFSSINHNKILKKKVFDVETDIAHAKRKCYYKQFQSALFYLKKIFIFETTFVVKQFINHNAHYQCHVIVVSKYHDKKLSKF